MGSQNHPGLTRIQNGGKVLWFLCLVIALVLIMSLHISLSVVFCSSLQQVNLFSLNLVLLSG